MRNAAGNKMALLLALCAMPARFLEGAPAQEGKLVEAQLSYEAIQQMLHAALRRHYGLGDNEYVWPEAVYADSVVVRRDGKLWQFPYSVDDANRLRLGAAREVVMEPVPVRGQLVEAVADEAEKPANRFVIRVIRAGLSANGVDYPTDVLRESAPLLQGVRVYAVSDAEHLAGGIAKRDATKIIGRLSAPRFVESAIGGEVLADLTVIESTGWAQRFREAIAAGIPDTYAFSIDAAGTMTRKGRFREARSITRFHSVDVVAEPGAGGQLIRLAEAAAHPHEEKLMNREQMLGLLKTMNPARAAALATATDDEVAGAFREAVEAQSAAAQSAAAGVAGSGNHDAIQDAIRMVEARAAARETIRLSGLPAPAIERLTAQFQGADRFTEADVSTAIQNEREYIGRFSEARIEGLGSIQIVRDQADKARQRLDDIFDPSKPLTSFREAYIDFTGDRHVTGLISNCDRRRMAEALGGDGRFAEAISSSSWGEALGDAITRAMVREYAQSSMWDDWRFLCDVVPVSDFRTQRRIRIGGYGNLPAVAQDGPYNALTSPADEEATYAATKRGGVETVSLEAIANDDVGAIRRIPVKLVEAAKRTLYTFVMDFLATNPTVYDGVALFHASHNNLGTAALDATTFAAARLAMLKQAEAGSSARVGLITRHLLVPTDLEEAAFNLFVRNTNNDETFVQSRKPQVHVVPYWTDANNWYATADKAAVQLIELGFYGGREMPEIFVQDNPTQGSLFSNDQIKYKIRHIYGGAVIDYRGFYGAVVA
jgi:hypothetical protein